MVRFFDLLLASESSVVPDAAPKLSRRGGVPLGETSDETVAAGVGPSGISVTRRQNVDIARKQNLAGVVNAKRIGRTCAASSYTWRCTDVGFGFVKAFDAGYISLVDCLTGNAAGSAARCAV